MRVLLVEPEPEFAARVVAVLAREGITAHTVGTASEARAVAADMDLVVTEVVLPDGSGFDLCREWRDADRAPRCIVLAESASEADRVAAFEAGADDVIVKDRLSLRELELRVRAVGRRPPTIRPESLPEATIGPLTIRADDGEVEVDGQLIRLTSTERALLDALVRRPGRVLDRETLVLRVWNGVAVDARTVDSTVKRLRARLGAVGDRIETVRGVGYRLRDG